MNGNKRLLGVAITAIAVAAALVPTRSGVDAADTVLKLRAAGTGPGAPAPTLTIELFRWTSDAERAPLVEALSAPPPPPASPPSAPAPAAAAGGRAAGRGGRGGRAAGPPPTPLERLGAAIKAAPTVGYIWGDGAVGYSIKYASKLALPGGGERIVLMTDRRLGADSAAAGVARADTVAVDFTVIEMRLDGKGSGEAKASISGQVVVDPATKMLALEGYAAAPAVLKVTR